MYSVPVISDRLDNEDVSFSGGGATHFLINTSCPPTTLAGFIKNIGSEPFFTLAGHITHTHTHTPTHALDVVVHFVGVGASVPSTPRTSA